MDSRKANTTPQAATTRKNGRQGGLATALKYGPEFCQARAEKGGQALLDRYGKDYYTYITKFRTRPKGWPKGKSRKESK